MLTELTPDPFDVRCADFVFYVSFVFFFLVRVFVFRRFHSFLLLHAVGKSNWFNCFQTEWGDAVKETPYSKIYVCTRRTEARDVCGIVDSVNIYISPVPLIHLHVHGYTHTHAKEKRKSCKKRLNKINLIECYSRFRLMFVFVVNFLVVAFVSLHLVDIYTRIHYTYEYIDFKTYLRAWVLSSSTLYVHSRRLT